MKGANLDGLLFEADIDLAIRSKNLVILGLFIANEFNQINRTLFQDSRKKTLKFRQGLVMAIISSLLNYGISRCLCELSMLIDISYVFGYVVMVGIFTKMPSYID